MPSQNLLQSPEYSKPCLDVISWFLRCRLLSCICICTPSVSSQHVPLSLPPSWTHPTRVTVLYYPGSLVLRRPFGDPLGYGRSCWGHGVSGLSQVLLCRPCLLSLHGIQLHFTLQRLLMHVPCGPQNTSWALLEITKITIFWPVKLWPHMVFLHCIVCRTSAKNTTLSKNVPRVFDGSKLAHKAKERWGSRYMCVVTPCTTICTYVRKQLI